MLLTKCSASRKGCAAYFSHTTTVCHDKSCYFPSSSSGSSSQSLCSAYTRSLSCLSVLALKYYLFPSHLIQFICVQIALYCAVENSCSYAQTSVSKVPKLCIHTFISVLYCACVSICVNRQELLCRLL